MKLNKKLFLQTVERYSYFKDSVDWVDFKKMLESIPERLETLEPVQGLLKKIDKHSFAIINYGKEEKDVETTQDIPQIITKECDEDTGLLKLPGFYSPDNDAEELKQNYKKIIAALKKVKNKKNLILDLTDNSGGNMYPWMAALAPLYDTGTVGYFEYKYKDEKEAWMIKEDGVYCGSKKWFGEKNEDQFDFSKIAVIISPKTVSSGEAIAMSLKGQSNVKLFGEQTGGFTTGNEEYKIEDITIWLSTGMMLDRNFQSFPDGVTPDVKTTKALKDSLQWLNVDS